MVDFAPDYKVKIVQNFLGPDEWQFVDSYPDFTIQFKDSSC